MFGNPSAPVGLGKGLPFTVTIPTPKFQILLRISTNSRYRILVKHFRHPTAALAALELGLV